MLTLSIPIPNAPETVTASIRRNNEWSSKAVECVKVIAVEQYGIFGPCLVTDAEWRLTERTPLTWVKLYRCPSTPRAWKHQVTQRTLYDLDEAEDAVRELIYPRDRLLRVPPAVTRVMRERAWEAIAGDPLHKQYKWEDVVRCASLLLTGGPPENCANMHLVQNAIDSPDVAESPQGGSS